MIENKEQEQAPKEPAFTLLGTIGYDKPEDFDKFSDNLDIQGSIFVLMHAANYAQTRGCYNLNEASLIAKAIRNLVKKAEVDMANSAKTETPTTNPQN